MSLRYIQAIFIAARAGAAMIRLPEVLATAGLGLDGDRYANHAGYYSPHDDVCEVTLIEGEVLDRIEAIDGLRVQHGEHRRNIVTRGLILRELQSAWCMP
jgi:MOSC domain-containing protein YiiM